MKNATLIVFAALAIVLTACAGKPVRRAIAIPAPDVAIVKAPIAKAQEYSSAATGKVTVVKTAVARSQALVEQLQPVPADVAAVEMIKLELLTAQEAAEIAAENLAAVQVALTDATGKADALQVETDKLRDRAINESFRADKAEDLAAAEIKAHTNTKFRYWRLKLIASAIIAAVLCVVALWLTPKNPPWLIVAIPLAAGAAGFGLGWIFL